MTILTSDGKIIVGEIMTKEEAKKKYEEAIKNNMTAYMANYDSDNA